jgi:hypothetical protein
MAAVAGRVNRSERKFSNARAGYKSAKPTGFCAGRLPSRNKTSADMVDGIWKNSAMAPANSFTALASRGSNDRIRAVATGTKGAVI